MKFLLKYERARNSGWNYPKSVQVNKISGELGQHSDNCNRNFLLRSYCTRNFVNLIERIFRVLLPQLRERSVAPTLVRRANNCVTLVNLLCTHVIRDNVQHKNHLSMNAAWMLLEEVGASRENPIARRNGYSTAHRLDGATSTQEMAAVECRRSAPIAGETYRSWDARSTWPKSRRTEIYTGRDRKLHSASDKYELRAVMHRHRDTWCVARRSARCRRRRGI